MAPAIAFTNLGCRLNIAESDALAARFVAAGYRVVPTTEPADVVVVNTCTVTGQADRKSRNALNRAARSGARPHTATAGSADAGARAETRPLVVATGCYVTAHGGVACDLPGVDYAVDNDRKEPDLRSGGGAPGRRGDRPGGAAGRSVRVPARRAAAAYPRHHQDSGRLRQLLHLLHHPGGTRAGAEPAARDILDEARRCSTKVTASWCSPASISDATSGATATSAACWRSAGAAGRLPGARLFPGARPTRRPFRRPDRPRAPVPAPAPVPAERLRPHPAAHAPRVRRRPLPRPDRPHPCHLAAARRAGPLHHRHHGRLPRRNRRRLRAHRGGMPGRRLRPHPYLPLLAARRHQGARLSDAVPEPVKAERSATVRALAATGRRRLAQHLTGHCQRVLVEQVSGAFATGYGESYLRIRFPAAGTPQPGKWYPVTVAGAAPPTAALQALRPRPRQQRIPTQPRRRLAPRVTSNGLPPPPASL